MAGSVLKLPAGAFVGGLCVLAAGIVAVLALATGGEPAEVAGQTPEERIESITRIAGEQSAAVGRALARAATSDADPAVRQAALIGLTQHTRPELRPAVEKALGDSDAAVRAAAAGALSLYRDDDATDGLARLASGDGDQQVRQAAARGLGVCTSNRSVVALMELAETSPDLDMRVQAIESLLRKFNMRFFRRPDPRNVPMWQNFIEHVKGYSSVQRAYAAAGATLTRRPEHRVVTEHDVREGHSDWMSK